MRGRGYPGTAVVDPTTITLPTGPAPGAPRRPTYRILVTGSRRCTPAIALFVGRILNAHLIPAGRDVVVVHGDCPTGIDQIARVWARKTGISEEPHPADWARLGRGAGPHRNAHMVGLGADVCFGFPAADSRGTWDCIRKAQEAGIPTHVHPLLEA